jgi:hypothetical protein
LRLGSLNANTDGLGVDIATAITNVDIVIASENSVTGGRA